MWRARGFRSSLMSFATALERLGGHVREAGPRGASASVKSEASCRSTLRRFNRASRRVASMMLLAFVAVVVNGALVLGLALAFWPRRRGDHRTKLLEEMRRAACEVRR